MIGDEVFLLLTKDNGGAEGWLAHRGVGLVAAAVTDLAIAGRITLSDDKDPKVEVVDHSPTGDAALDHVLARLEEKRTRRFSMVVQDTKANPEEIIARRFADQGVVEYKDKKLLGMVPARYPVLDPAPEQAVRDRLGAVLRGGAPTPADLTELAILKGLGALWPVLQAEAGGMSRSEANARVEQLSLGDDAGAAVRSAVTAIVIAITTPTIIATVASTS